MKLCFTTFACPNWSLRQVVRTAAKHDYQGIEFRTDAGHTHGVEVWTSLAERTKFRTEVEKAGLVVPCLASSIQFNVENIQEQAFERIKLASDLGAPGIRVFFGHMPEGMPSMDEAMRRVVRQMREACEFAQMYEVEIWLETHDLVSRGADAAAVIREVDRPNLGICYNNLHPIRRGEALETTIAHLAPMIRHVHLHDGMNLPDKVIVTPIGNGQMPMDDTMVALANIGYGGFLSGEWFHDQYGDIPENAIEQYAYEMRLLAHRHKVPLGLGV